MHDRTAAFIEMLSLADWFSAVGQHINRDVKVVTSWTTAFELCSTDEWENTQLAIRGDLTSNVSMLAPDRDRLWNDLAGEIGVYTGPLVRQKVNNLSKRSQLQLPKIFIDSVLWDITSIVQATEYADIYLPPLYVDLASWYVKGHFPCGWEGEYPEGRLIIY